MQDEEKENVDICVVMLKIVHHYQG